MATTAMPIAAQSTQLIVVPWAEAGAFVTEIDDEVAVTLAPFESVTFTETLNGEPCGEVGAQTSAAVLAELHPVGSPTQT